MSAINGLLIYCGWYRNSVVKPFCTRASFEASFWLRMHLLDFSFSNTNSVFFPNLKPVHLTVWNNEWILCTVCDLILNDTYKETVLYAVLYLIWIGNIWSKPNLLNEVSIGPGTDPVNHISASLLPTVQHLGSWSKLIL